MLVRTDQPVVPFSWYRYIVMSEKDLAENGEAIVLHEKAHLRLRHSFDLLLTDLAGCLQWFNPAMRSPGAVSCAPSMNTKPNEAVPGRASTPGNTSCY